MSLVVDASLTLAWYFEDEAAPATEGVLDLVSESSAVVPALWRFEVGNALQMSIRRKRIDAAYRDAVLTELAALPIAIDLETDTHAWTRTLRLTELFGLTLYDAAYLELAQRRGIPLASLDQEMCAAAAAINATIL
jgi:predicted nucleic acid-binding protein